MEDPQTFSVSGICACLMDVFADARALGGSRMNSVSMAVAESRRRAMRLVIQLPQAEDTRKAWTVARAGEVGRMLLRYSASQSGSATSPKDYVQVRVLPAMPQGKVEGN